MPIENYRSLVYVGVVATQDLVFLRSHEGREYSNLGLISLRGIEFGIGYITLTFELSGGGHQIKTGDLENCCAFTSGNLTEAPRNDI